MSSPSPASADPPRSRTRSFARRGDRMPAKHAQAYAELGPSYLVPVPRTTAEGSTGVDPQFRFDQQKVFGRTAPLVIEVGSGSGDAVLAGAAARPEWNFLALEVWRPGIGHALHRMRDELPGNIRFVEVDAARALPTMIAAGSIEQVWTFFPDPWPKARHHKRRLVNADFTAAVCRALRPGGQWLLATDWDHYAVHIRELLDAEPLLQYIGNERAPLRPQTRFERRGVQAGRTITDLAYTRLSGDLR